MEENEELTPIASEGSQGESDSPAENVSKAEKKQGFFGGRHKRKTRSSGAHAAGSGKLRGDDASDDAEGDVKNDVKDDVVEDVSGNNDDQADDVSRRGDGEHVARVGAHAADADSKPKREESSGDDGLEEPDAGAQDEGEAGDDWLAEFPTLEELRAERARQKAVVTKRRWAGGILAVLVVAAAAATLAVTLWFPVLSITGDSMSPALQRGDMVMCTSQTDCSQGDIIAFYVDNRVLVKRVIATEGQILDIDRDGNVYIDGELLDEPYLDGDAKSFGDCDISLPCKIPEDSYFVMGDNRAESLDSRHSTIGCARQDRVMCKLSARFWPLNRIGGLG